MSRLFRRGETREITSVPWSHGEDSPSVPSSARALSVVPVYAAVRLISESIATMPLHRYVRRPDGSRARLPLPVSIAAPVSGVSRISFIQQPLVSCLLHGEAIALLSGDDAGWPTGAQWVHPGDMSWVDGTWYFRGEDLDAGQVLHLPAFTVPGEKRGLSPISAFASTFDTGREAQLASRSWAKKRAIPGTIVKNTQRTLSGVQADEISERIKAKMIHGEPYVHGSDWDVSVIAIPPNDLAFLESIKANATQVATIYSLPPEMIGGATGESLTYSTTEQQLIRLLTYGLRPWMVRLEQALSDSLLPRGQYLRFNADALVRVDTKTRYEIHAIARRIGLNNIDELRAVEDLDPLPDGQGQSYAPLAGATSGGATA